MSKLCKKIPHTLDEINARRQEIMKSKEFEEILGQLESDVIVCSDAVSEGTDNRHHLREDVIIRAGKLVQLLRPDVCIFDLLHEWQS